MASKSQNDFGAFSFLIRGGRCVFIGDFAISTGEIGGFWMVNRGGFVVETWLLRGYFPGAKKLHFLEIYF
jgi:hypothetical protein